MRRCRHGSDRFMPRTTGSSMAHIPTAASRSSPTIRIPALALQASFLDPDDRTADALWNINRDRNWAGFRAALADVVGPQQNIVYADTGGTIGFIAPARILIRKSGNGWMPVPGWTGAYDWAGYIPFDELPQATDPPAGHFASANNKIVPERYPFFVSRD